MNTKVKLLAAGCIVGLVLAATALLAAGEANVLTQADVESTTNSVFAWDSVIKATNVAATVSEASFVFHFTNVTTGKIIINDVSTSCGCTTVEIPTLPWTILAGTNAQIAVSVNLSDTEGTVSKMVDVVTDKGTDELAVEATILPPAKASVR